MGGDFTCGKEPEFRCATRTNHRTTSFPNLSPLHSAPHFLQLLPPGQGRCSVANLELMWRSELLLTLAPSIPKHRMLPEASQRSSSACAPDISLCSAQTGLSVANLMSHSRPPSNGLPHEGQECGASRSERCECVVTRSVGLWHWGMSYLAAKPKRRAELPPLGSPFSHPMSLAEP
ncbi:hypothetical protein JZ751_017916 [Albula glossodonta]|uniref:Uncharacterized protein n=1 Tax=Albula glossodonta TaxID=121402 RepID=A0A8T2PPR8_9TELE|nr:hypothetical protein JZ751_017916 [Albula glossodonta]